MYGNLVNNRQLLKLIEDNDLEIKGFDKRNLSLVHYTLHPSIIKERKSDGSWIVAHDFNSCSQPYILQPNGYVIVEVAERIILKNDFLVGEFIPASNLIEAGLDLVSGKIDKKYGNTGEELGGFQEVVIFGLKNLLNDPNEIKSTTRIAHVSFSDLRGLENDDLNLTEEEIKIRIRRTHNYAIDDGVLYEKYNEE